MLRAATNGIGKAIAIHYANEANTVIVVGRDEYRGNDVVSSIIDAGGSAVFVSCNLENEKSIQNLVEIVQSKYGIPEILVNCGGILQSGTRVLEQSFIRSR